eukprot:7930288-Alexandrium_andersonii.AAC.1
MGNSRGRSCVLTTVRPDDPKPRAELRMGSSEFVRAHIGRAPLPEHCLHCAWTVGVAPHSAAHGRQVSRFAGWQAQVFWRTQTHEVSEGHERADPCSVNFCYDVAGGGIGHAWRRLA